MAAPWVAGAQARIIGEIHGQQTVNVLHFATNTQINDDDNLDDLLLQLAQFLLECVRDTLLPGVSTDWKVVRCDAKRIYPVPSDPIVASGTPEDHGGLSGASTSFEASLLQLRTGGGGKRGRGRLFLPPAGEANVSQSVIDAPTLLLLAEFATCLATKFLGANATSDWRLGVLSTKTLHQAVGGGFDNAFRIVSSMSPVADVAVMSSRRKGRGA